MFILDTNVVSELMRDEPAPEVSSWLRKNDFSDCFLTAVNEAEVRYGLRKMPFGRKRRELEASIVEWIDTAFRDRILPFDSAAAKAYAEIYDMRRRLGREISKPDAAIAAVARVHEACLATRNLRDFAGTGIFMVNPWDGGNILYRQATLEEESQEFGPSPLP